MTGTGATNSRSRKRVRFEEDPATRQVKRRVREMLLPKSSLLTEEEKSCYWMQHQDHRDTLHDVMSLMHDCRNENTNGHNDKKNPITTTSDSDNDPNKVSFAQYAEALALTFTLCDTPPIITPEEDNEGQQSQEDPDDTPSWNIRDSRSVGQLALWASHHTPTRGVESKILPGLNHERLLRRSRTIQGVLEAQKQLKSNNQKESMATTLGAISRACSHSAKQFATALAVVDGTQAWLEYQRLSPSLLSDSKEVHMSDENSNQQQQPGPSQKQIPMCSTPCLDQVSQ